MFALPSAEMYAPSAPFCRYSIQYVLSQVDSAIQYGEDEDVKIRDVPDEDWSED